MAKQTLEDGATFGVQTAKINDNFTELYEGKVDVKTGKSLIDDSEIIRLASVTNQSKGGLGLSNVDNTSDVNKPVSNATATAISGKVDKVAGKSLIADTEITRLSTVVNQNISGKQDTLVSGTNIKTVNGTSILGSGDIVIAEGGGGDFKGSISPTDQTPTINGTYVPTSSGTYTNAGGQVVNLADGYTTLILTGGVWTKQVAPVAITGGKIEDWTAKPYPVGTQVSYLGVAYEALAGTNSTTVPGISPAWVAKIGNTTAPEWTERGYSSGSLVYRDGQLWESVANTTALDVPTYLSSKWTAKTRGVKAVFDKTNVKDSASMSATNKMLVDLDVLKVGSQVIIDETFDNNNLGWAGMPSLNLPFTISSGLMTFTTTASKNQGVSVGYNFTIGVPITVSVKIRKLTANNTQLSIGTTMTSGTSASVKTFDLGEITSVFQTFTFTITPTSLTNSYLSINASSNRNFGDSFEIDSIKLTDPQGVTKSTKLATVFNKLNENDGATMKAISDFVTASIDPEAEGSDLSNVLSVIGNPNDNINIALSAGGIVHLKPITYTTATPLTILSNTQIKGIKGLTKIVYTGSANLIPLDATKENISISDVYFDGGNVNDTNIITIAAVKAKTGLGTQNCISVEGAAKNVRIEGCEIVNFSGAGIKVKTTLAAPQSYHRNMKINNNAISGCYIGLWFDQRAEYHTFIGNSFSYNKIGAWIEGGNNVGSTNNFNANFAGVVVSGILNRNDSHGSISTSTFNHNTRYSIISIDIHNGFMFTGCQAFDGTMYIENSMGFSFTSGEIGGTIETVTDNGSNVIANSMFATVPTFTGTSSKLSMFGNRYINGGSPTILNNLI